MIGWNVVIGIGILILIGLGFMFVTTMTGNVITGAISNGKVVGEEYFRISEFGNSELNNEVKYGENNSGPK